MMEEKESRRLEEIMEQLEEMKPGQQLLDEHEHSQHVEKIKQLEEITKQESDQEVSEDSDQEG